MTLKEYANTLLFLIADLLVVIRIQNDILNEREAHVADYFYQRLPENLKVNNNVSGGSRRPAR